MKRTSETLERSETAQAFSLGLHAELVDGGLGHHRRADGRGFERCREPGNPARPGRRVPGFASVIQHVLPQVNGTNLGNEKYADRAYDRHFLPGPTRQVLFSPVITW